MVLKTVGSNQWKSTLLFRTLIVIHASKCFSSLVVTGIVYYTGTMQICDVFHGKIPLYCGKNILVYAPWVEYFLYSAKIYMPKTSFILRLLYCITNTFVNINL